MTLGMRIKELKNSGERLYLYRYARTPPRCGLPADDWKRKRTGVSRHDWFETPRRYRETGASGRRLRSRANEPFKEPIGLKIGGVTPEEIAISILAEIIQVKRMDREDKRVKNRSDLDFDVLKRLAEEPDESKQWSR